MWEQRTLVIRLLLIRKAATPLDLLDATVFEFGREIATKVAIGEEQIWICHYPQSLRIFTGLQQLMHWRASGKERRMRIVVNQYADGDMFAVETASDGSVVLGDLVGRPKPGGTVSAYAEVACDDNETGLERLRRIAGVNSSSAGSEPPGTARRSLKLGGTPERSASAPWGNTGTWLPRSHPVLDGAKKADRTLWLWSGFSGNLAEPEMHGLSESKHERLHRHRIRVAPRMAK